MAEVTQITNYTPEEIQTFLKQGIQDAVRQMEWEMDIPKKEMMERLAIKDERTFRKRIQEKKIKPTRIVGNVPLYRPSAFIQ